MSDQIALSELLGTSSKSQSSFDLKTVAHLVRRFYWIVLLFVAAAVAAAFAYLKTTTYVYQATAKMRIERRPMIVASTGVLSDTGLSSDADLQTLELSFLSKDLFTRVADKLTLDECRKLLGEESDLPVKKQDVARALAQGGSVALIEGTRLMNVSFDSTSPALAERIANLLLEQGIALDTDQRVNAVDSNIKFLQGESEKLEAKLKEAEENLNSYTKRLGTVSIDDNLNIVAEQLRTLNSRVGTAQAERLKLESDYSDIQEAKGDPEKLLRVESIQKLPTIAPLLIKNAEIQQEIATMTRRYRAENPRLEQLVAQQGDIERKLHEEAVLAPSAIETSVAMARRTEFALAAQRDAQEKETIQIKESSVESKVLQRKIDADKLAYETVLRRLNEELSQVRAQPVILQIVERAAGAKQVKPKPAQVLLIAIFLGGAIGVGIVFLIMQLDTSMRSVEEAEQALGLPVLAMIPKNEEAFKAALSRSETALSVESWKTLPVFVDKHSTSAEAFRTLNASVQMIGVNENQNFTLVTSSIPGEGKSYTCLNAATAIALSGRRTLLVDADLRKPVIEMRFFGTRERAGLADFLSGRMTMEEIIYPTGLKSLDIVTAGRPGGDPGELLSRHRFKAFLDEAKTKYDQIIFDSAPVTVVSDTLCFARFFHVVCVVTMAGKTPRNAAKRTIELLRRSGATPSGVVINCVTKEFQSRYHGYTSYYGHQEPTEEPVVDSK